ncbi:pyridoxine/pyridoxamine 5'-phosphate oxidase [Microbacterium karelineae]|uniref:pyridoxine/pyridoxamine 5'-phosphate oxidase n=1 Tax=Microbacterium karelineae TaxID=2654283 RepID=UPI0012EA666D|nr:pyridoxamine 5'-phosphate oxidase family protein [Microbacterium karelineae]
MTAQVTSVEAGNVPPAELDRPVQDGRAPAEPAALLRAWMPADDDPDRPLATLATVDDDGVPDARTVLVSAIDDTSVAIHTDADSRKARQMRARPVAALVVRWPDTARQIVLRGPVRRDTADGERAAFARRSRYLQLLASINSDDMAVRARAEREAALARFDAAHADPPMPPTWAGFRLLPDEIAFWEGAERGPSRRVRYTRDGAGWSREYVAG